MLKSHTRTMFVAIAAFAMTMAVAANHHNNDAIESKPATLEAIPKPVDISTDKVLEAALTQDPVKQAMNALNSMDSTVVSVEDIAADNRQRRVDVPSSSNDPVT